MTDRREREIVSVAKEEAKAVGATLPIEKVGPYLMIEVTRGGISKRVKVGMSVATSPREMKNFVHKLRSLTHN